MQLCAVYTLAFYSCFVKMSPNIDKNVQKCTLLRTFFAYSVEIVYFCWLRVCINCIFMQMHFISFDFVTIALAFQAGVKNNII